MRSFATVRAVLVSLCTILSACSIERTPIVAPLAQRVTDIRVQAGARSEGRVVIFGTTETPRVAALIRAFETRHPYVDVRYVRGTSAETYSLFLAEDAAGRSPDLVWNSAMSHQIKLINDGFAQSYVSREKSALPDWAVWKNQGYGTTAEPIAIGYNRRQLSNAKALQNHAALREELEQNPAIYRGKIGLLDPTKSGIGFLAYAQDLQASAESDDLYALIAASQPKVYETNRELLDDLVSGRIGLAYNILSSYAVSESRSNPNVGVVLPDDYTLVTSRIAFISARAPHPNAARLFLDFLLSPEGQSLLDQQDLGAVRVATSKAQVGRSPSLAGPRRPVEVGPALLADLDQMRRRRLLSAWEHAVEKTTDKRPAAA